jgi:hypothetical protein
MLLLCIPCIGSLLLLLLFLHQLLLVEEGAEGIYAVLLVYVALLWCLLSQA